MKKLKMSATKTMTFEEGCNKYLEYCRQRNLREGTIRHYRQSYKTGDTVIVCLSQAGMDKRGGKLLLFFA